MRGSTALTLFLLTSFLATSNLAAAQDLVITNARILDGTGRVLEQGSVTVRNGQIVAVSAGAPAAPGSQQINARGMTVMPGLIETHVHLLLGDRSVKSQAEQDGWINTALPRDLMSYLESGFTTIMSAGDNVGAIVQVKRRIDAGELKGPRLLVSGPTGLYGPRWAPGDNCL